MAAQDRMLTCRDCGSAFPFPAERQEEYIRAGFTDYEPPRCSECVEKYKSARRERAGGGTPAASQAAAAEPEGEAQNGRNRRKR